MSVTTFIARRYLKADKENRFLSWISVLSVFGIAIGVAAMIVVLSVINAFEDELRNRFLAANAHVLLYRFPSGLEDYHLWREKISKEFPSIGIKATSPFVYYETMAKKDTFMHGILIRGIIPSYREKVQPLSDLVSPKGALDIIEKDQRSGNKDIPPIIIGKGLMNLLDAKIGDNIFLVSPKENSFSAVKKFHVVGFYYSGLKHYDDKIGFLSLGAAQEFFGMGTVVTGLEIGLDDPDKSILVARKLEAAYPLSVKEWQSYNKPIFEAMKMERVVIALIVALVALVASFNILTTMFVAVTQKQKDISILKSLGANNRDIMFIFIKQGMLIALVGSGLGVLLALILSEIIKSYDIINLPDIYMLARLPVEFNIVVYAVVALSSIGLAILAGLGPAIIAANVTPTEGLRAADLKN